MARRYLVDFASIDPDRVLFTREEIRAYNPQRYEFEQLDAIVFYDPEEGIAVARRDLRPDEFWVRGHLPGRPLFPGVLMLEAAAQLCSFYCRKTLGIDALHGFGGADQVRFRRTVHVGERLLIAARPDVMTPSRSLFQTQGAVGGAIAFEARILGIALK